MASPASSPGAAQGGVSGKVVVISFLTLLILATVAVYFVVVQLKRGGTDALRENKERRVPQAASAAHDPPAKPAQPAP